MDCPAARVVGVPDDPRDVAEAFARLFPAIYLRFHRRDDRGALLSGASRAVLQHLTLTGPLTVGELAQHLDRAQSVVSDIVATASTATTQPELCNRSRSASSG